jgi:cholesterol oxidase
MAAASRLAPGPRRPAGLPLERGKELSQGQYPDTLAEAGRADAGRHPEGHVGSPLGLFDFRMNDDINVFQGCGLGGTSLVNANVSIRPEPRIFDDARWPAALRQEPVLLEDGFRHAEEMLKPVRYPENGLPLPKLEAPPPLGPGHERPLRGLPINVTFKEPPSGINHVGVEQHACTLCGDCVTGCNHRAKNTTLMNYLPDAWNHGAEIFTQVSVRRVAANPAPSPTSPGRWLIYFRPLGVGIERFGDDDLVVRADGGGAGGGGARLAPRSCCARASTGCRCPTGWGRGFTGNGDVLAFAYNNDQGHQRRGRRDPPARGSWTPRARPCITGPHRPARLHQSPLEDNVIIEEGSLPGALAPAPPRGPWPPRRRHGIDTDSGVRDYLAERTREVESLTLGSHRGAVANTQTYLVMANDDASGLMALEGDRLRIRWPGVGEQPLFGKIHGRLEQATKGLGGTFVKNPIWFELSKHPLVTVHPLGGLRDGRGRRQGRGQPQAPGVLGQDRHRGPRRPLCLRRLGGAAGAGGQSAPHHLGAGRAVLRAFGPRPEVDHRLRAPLAAQGPAPARAAGHRVQREDGRAHVEDPHQPWRDPRHPPGRVPGLGDRRQGEEERLRLRLDHRRP